MKTMKTRLISILLAFVMTAGLFLAVPLETYAAPEKQTRTVMFYLDGSNLERLWGCATWNLVQAMEAGYDENLNFIVMTGGSKKWQTQTEYLDGAEKVDAAYNQIWKLEGKRGGEEHGKMKLLEPTGIEGAEQTDMALPETLVSFVDYCYENYPADQYDLILWDHGGGFAYGFGHDERFKDRHTMYPATMISMFREMKLIKDGKKFEILNFDACLMSSAELVAVLEPYADYLVASAETEPGYGHEYTSWLNAVRENPGMNGFELGKLIVDGLAKFYTDECVEVGTLSVIDTTNFVTRLMPLLEALDDILIREAKLVGEQNGRYNFYDELYALLTAFVYDGNASSLYDLGNLVGGLSSPQSEMDNATAAEINALTNAYTSTALQILAILGDCDGSGDDVVYSAESEIARLSVSSYYIRGLDGAFLQPEEDGTITIDPTGFSCFFGDGNVENAFDFAAQINEARKVLTDGPTKDFLRKRALVAAYYALIVRFGEIVSELSETAEETVTWEDVWGYVGQLEDESAYVSDLFRMIMVYDDVASESEVEAIFSKIVGQQAEEAIRPDKISVKRLVEADGSSNFYQVTVRNASSQSLMSVISSALLEIGDCNSEEYEKILRLFFGKSFSEMYPDGVFFFNPEFDGTLDHYRYYEQYDENSADIYRRIYSDSTSVWIVPQVSAYCFSLTDSDGVVHPARIDYVGSSRTRATLPLQLVLPEDEYRDAALSISFNGSAWQVDGISFSTDDERGSYPMDSEIFNGSKYATAAQVPYYTGEAIQNPISQFSVIDVSKKDWGITLGWKKIEEIPGIINSYPFYFVNDVYGYGVDVTDLFYEADEAAEKGDVAYTIDCADFTIAEAVWNGEAQTPEVTAVRGTPGTRAAVTLTEGVDYKVLYDGSSDPGEAHLAVIGIGDYYGALDLTYVILDSLTVKVDGTEISEENYTVDETTGAVALTEDYLKTLAVGAHTLTVEISGVGTATNFTVDPVAYQVTEGAGSEWVKGSADGLSFKTDAEAGKLSAVEVDGAAVASGNYTVGADGTVTLKDSFLKTLSTGAHTLTLTFTDGEASAQFTVRAANASGIVADQTGDPFDMPLWIAVTVISFSGIIAFAIWTKSRVYAED